MKLNSIQWWGSNSGVCGVCIIPPLLSGSFWPQVEVSPIDKIDLVWKLFCDRNTWNLLTMYKQMVIITDK